MKNKFLLFVAAVGSAIAAGAVELDGGWVLSMDPTNVGKTNGWAAAVRPDAKPVPVPGVIQQVYPHSCGVAWYWRRVARPATRPGERVILRFGAVDYYSDVYVDGTKIGSNEGAENTFEFDVTDAIKADSLLAVRVINPGETPIEGFTCKNVPHRNKFEKMEFKPGWCYNTGGITLPVTLEAVPAVRVTDAFVKADWKTGRVTVEITARNDTASPCEKEIPCVVQKDDARDILLARRAGIVSRRDLDGHAAGLPVGLYERVRHAHGRHSLQRDGQRDAARVVAPAGLELHLFELVAVRHVLARKALDRRLAGVNHAHGKQGIRLDRVGHVKLEGVLRILVAADLRAVEVDIAVVVHRAEAENHAFARTHCRTRHAPPVPRDAAGMRVDLLDHARHGHGFRVGPHGGGPAVRLARVRRIHRQHPTAVQLRCTCHDDVSDRSDKRKKFGFHANSIPYLHHGARGLVYCAA